MIVTDSIGRGYTSPIVYIEDSLYFDHFYVMKRLYKCTKNGKRYRHGILVVQCVGTKFKDRTFIKPGRYKKVKNYAKRMNEERN